MEIMTTIHLVAEAAILLLVIKGTRTIDKIEFRVELLWQHYLEDHKHSKE